MASELPHNFDPSQLNMDIVAEWLNKLKYNQEAADPSSTDISDDSSTERKNSDRGSTARSRRHQKTTRNEQENEKVGEKAKKRMNKLEKLFRRSYHKEEPGKMCSLSLYNMYSNCKIPIYCNGCTGKLNLNFIRSNCLRSQTMLEGVHLLDFLPTGQTLPTKASFIPATS